MIIHKTKMKSRLYYYYVITPYNANNHFPCKPKDQFLEQVLDNWMIGMGNKKKTKLTSHPELPWKMCYQDEMIRYDLINNTNRINQFIYLKRKMNEMEKFNSQALANRPTSNPAEPVSQRKQTKPAFPTLISAEEVNQFLTPNSIQPLWKRSQLQRKSQCTFDSIWRLKEQIKKQRIERNQRRQTDRQSVR